MTIVNKHKQQDGEWRVADGGWGWMIVLGGTIIFTLVNNFPVCYGIIFSEWFYELGVSSTTIGIIFNINCVLWNMMFLFVGPLVEEFGWRRVGMFCNFMAALAMFLSAFVTTITQLIFTYSILGGVFGGLCFAQIFIILPKYFDKHLGVASALPMAAFSICQFIFPLLIPYLQDQIGFQRSIMILGGIMLISVAAAVLFQPPEWHRIIIQTETNEISNKEQKVFNNNYIKENNIADSNVYKNNNIHVEPEEKNILKKISDSVICVLKGSYRNLAILKKPKALIIALGHCLFKSSTINFIALVPLVVVNAGYSLEEAGWVMSYGATASFLARLSSSILSDFAWFKIPVVYVCGTVISFIAIIGFAFTNNILYLNILSALQGIGQGANMTLFNLVTKEIVGIDDHSASLGASGSMLSMGFLILGPLVGLITDLSQSYIVTLLFIALLNALSVLLWLCMPYANSNKLKKGKQVAGDVASCGGEEVKV